MDWSFLVTPTYLGLAAAALLFWLINTLGRHASDGQMLEAAGSFLWFLTLCAMVYFCGWLAGGFTLAAFFVAMVVLQVVTRRVI